MNQNKEPGKEDTFNRIIEKAKQEYWNELDHLAHPSKQKGHIVTQEEWEKRQKDAKREHKQNPLLYSFDKIYGLVPDYEKSLEDMQEDADANARISGEWLEKEFDEDYLHGLLSEYKPRPKPKPKVENPNRLKLRDFLHESEWEMRYGKRVDDIEPWRDEVTKKICAEIQAERNAKYGKREDFKFKTQWMKHIRSNAT